MVNKIDITIMFQENIDDNLVIRNTIFTRCWEKCLVVADTNSLAVCQSQNSSVSLMPLCIFACLINIVYMSKSLNTTFRNVELVGSHTQLRVLSCVHVHLSCTVRYTLGNVCMDGCV